MITRQDRLDRIRERGKCDVLIVGAGINGIGTFLDLALQGINVVMVDRGDYCSGASAASSHMVHGGVRYLENGEFGLVSEAVQERGRLLTNAPHLVKPLPTTIPIFKWFSGLLNAPLQFLGLRYRPSERGVFVIKIGLILYEWFARRGRIVPRHKLRNHNQARSLYPDLNPEVIYAATYYDAIMNSPERLALDVLKDGIKANPNAIALNYVSLNRGESDKVLLKDEVSGEFIEIQPTVMINAAGPWIDFVNQSLGYEKRYIGGTKGSHLILDHPELRAAIKDNEMFFENKDGRIVLIMPFFDRVQIGSSDIRIDNPDDATITEEEIDYFFEMIKLVFPEIDVNRGHIVYTFSGVRPLPYQDVESTGQISRNHKVEVIPPNNLRKFPVFSLVGGKWTSFRAFAEHTSKIVLAWLEVPRLFETKERKIGGGLDFPMSAIEKEDLITAWQEDYGCLRNIAELLMGRYGTNAVGILEGMSTGDHSTHLKQLPEYSLGEIRYLVEKEDVVHLADLVFRRTSIAMRGRITEKGLVELAQIAADVLNWDSQQIQNEILDVQRILRNKHRMHFNQYLALTDDLNREVQT